MLPGETGDRIRFAKLLPGALAVYCPPPDFRIDRITEYIYSNWVDAQAAMRQAARGMFGLGLRAIRGPAREGDGDG
jgi:hypothetical protein